MNWTGELQQTDSGGADISWASEQWLKQSWRIHFVCWRKFLVFKQKQTTWEAAAVYSLVPLAHSPQSRPIQLSASVRPCRLTRGKA